MKDLSKAWEIRPLPADSGILGVNIQSFTSTALHRPDGTWRVWYSHTDPKIAGPNYGFGYLDFSAEFRLLRDTRMRIADRPEKAGLNILGVPAHWGLTQPVWLRLPDGRERLYFWAHHLGDGICRYLAAESADGVNFVVPDCRRPVLCHPHDRAVPLRTLEQRGVTFYSRKPRPAPDPDEPEIPGDMLLNDATNIYLLPDGSFELYSADVIDLPPDAPGPRQRDPIIRVIQRRTSADGLRWSPPRRILVRDGQDPFDLQFYYLAVNRTPRGRIGILGHYRSDPGTMDMEFCFSQDGIHWRRERRPGFPRAKGAETVYAPHDMVLWDGRYYLFYTGYNHTHHGQVSPDAPPGMPSSWIGLATIPAEAFA